MRLLLLCCATGSPRYRRRNACQHRVKIWPLEHLATHDDGFNSTGIANIRERVRIKQHQIGDLSRCDDAEFTLTGEEGGWILRRAPKRFHRSQSENNDFR